MRVDAANRILVVFAASLRYACALRDSQPDVHFSANLPTARYLTRACAGLCIIYVLWV